MDRFSNKSIITFLCMLFTFLGNQVRSQDNVLPINLETVMKLGGANNLTIQEYKQRQELTMANLSKAREWWLPNLYAGTTTHQLSGNAMNADGEILTDLNRQNFWGGLGLNATWDFGNGIYKAKANQLKVQASVYQTQAEQNKALLNVIQTYYDFLASQLYYKAYQQLATQAGTITDQIAIQVEAGLRYESELLLARSNYNHLKVEMLNARSGYNNESAALVKLLNLNPVTKLVGMDSILAPLNIVEINDVEMSFDSTYNLRPELIGMGLALQSLNAEKKITTTGLFLPELRIGTYGSYFGGVFSPLNPTSEISAALIWKIPLGRLTYGGRLKQYNARIALHENQMEQVKAEINQEVISAKEQIIIAKEQTQIAQEGSQLAEEALKQSVQRQQMGTIRPFEILQAQEIYIKSRLDYLKAVASYNKAQYAYHVAVGNNL